MADLDENAIELTELEKLKRRLKETTYDGPEQKKDQEYFIWNFKAGGFTKSSSSGKGKSKLIEGSELVQELHEIEQALFGNKKGKKKRRKKKRKP